MLRRSLYTLKQMFSYRKSIKGLKSGICIDSVINLSPELLDSKKIKYLALDFDGVLASHGKPEIYPEVKVWLDKFIKGFGQENIFILSNKPTQERLEYFNKHYPDIRFISGVAKKPYPDGMKKIRNILNCNPQDIALVDDRLLTGCLACLIAGSLPILVAKPYVDRQNYTKEEKFFEFLRKSEQKIFL